MPTFDDKPIGIGNITNLKRRAKAALEKKAVLQKVPQETEDDDVAQLAVDVYETNDFLYIIAPLAGVAAEEVRVEITDDVVIIEGERENPLGQSVEADDQLVSECYFGEFSRSIVLPESVDAKRAKAEFQKSVLIITLPKLDNLRTRIIKVKGS